MSFLSYSTKRFSRLPKLYSWSYNRFIRYFWSLRSNFCNFHTIYNGNYSIILLCSVFGWIGAAFSENKTIVRTFSVIQALELGFEIDLMVWFIQHKFDFKHKKVEKWLVDTMPWLLNSWSMYQIRHDCCGANNYTGWSEKGDLNLPQSCYKPELPDCARNRSIFSICCGREFAIYDCCGREFAVYGCCGRRCCGLHCNLDDNNDKVYKVGCQTSVASVMQDYKYTVIYAGLIVTSIQLLFLGFCILFCITRTKQKRKEHRSIHFSMPYVGFHACF